MMTNVKPGDVYVQDMGDGYRSIRVCVIDHYGNPGMVDIEIAPDGRMYAMHTGSGFHLHSDYPAVKLEPVVAAEEQAA